MKILEGKYRKKSEMLAYFMEHPNMFSELVESSLAVNENTAWRSALLVGHLIKKNDIRIEAFVDQYIDVLPKVSDGHQRQIFVILEKMKITEAQEGKLFNYCMDIWESVHKIPSTRIRAFWMMEKISENYKELQEELKHFVTPYFTETLSPGIKKYMFKKCNVVGWYLLK